MNLAMPRLAFIASRFGTSLKIPRSSPTNAAQLIDAPAWNSHGEYVTAAVLVAAVGGTVPNCGAGPKSEVCVAGEPGSLPVYGVLKLSYMYRLTWRKSRRSCCLTKGMLTMGQALK